MPWSGGAFTRTNGVHTGATLWVQDRDAGTKILAARHDTHDQDLAGGINSTLEKSGSNAATGNLNIGSNRLTAVADGTAKTDAATVNQLQSNAPAFQATDTGTANAHVIALSPAITAYAAGQAITFKSGAASTTASTVNVNGLGVKAIKKKNDQDIAAGDIESGSIVTVVYDGTNFQMTSQLATDDGLTIGGSNTQVQYNNSGALAGDADFTFDGSNVSLAKALYLADGAAATPSLTNTGDVNTGLYFPAADTIGVSLAGALDFQFEANDFTALSGSTISTNTIAETTADTGVTIDGVVVKDTGVATDDIILAGTKLLSIRFNIQNSSGTLVHYTYNVSNQAVNVGSYTGGINGLSATITTTPTGADSSTAFATGVKIGSATTSYIWFDTGAVSNTCYFTGHIIENRASPSAPLNADISAQNLNINGTTRVRLVIGHKLDTGAVFAINTTNIASAKLISYNINGWMTPA
jgi:hypothetical protein